MPSSTSTTVAEPTADPSAEASADTTAATTLSSGTTEGPTSSRTSGITERGDTSSTGEATDWWDTDYSRRVSLKFQPRAEPLVDFSAFVDLNLGERVFVGTERHQFVFVDVATEERIASEVVHVTPSGGRLRAWVRLPVWGERVTQVDMYWDPEGPMVDPINPWGAEYVGVWHMDGLTDALEVRNSSGGPPLRATGTSNAVDIAGRAYRAIEFDGDSDRMAADWGDSPPAPYFTISGWANLSAFAENGAPLFARGGGVGPEPTDTEWLLRFYTESTHARLHTAMGPPQEYTDASSGVALDTWHHYALRADSEHWAVFIDGLLVDEAAGTGAFEHQFALLSVGGYAEPDELNWSSRLFEGAIDEVIWREGGEASDAWIATLFENQQTPGDTYTVGAIQELR